MFNPNARLPVLTEAEHAKLRLDLRQIVEYRKSGLSLNHVIGCPLDCGYCVRHLFHNFEMKVPRALMCDEDAVITRWRVSEADCEVFNSLKNIKLTLLMTHSGIQDKRIEPFDSQIAVKSLMTAYANAESYRVIQYWRPIVPGLNDSHCHISRARELAEHAHATVYTGLFYRNEIRDYYRAHGIPEPYAGTARRKIFPAELEERILSAFRRPDGTFGPLFRKTSCGVSYAHELPDYNAHYGIRELCDICPVAQIGLCAKALTKPDRGLVETLAHDLGGKLIEINDRAAVVEGLNEQPRYLMQHSLGYQVHDVDKPHHQRQHGRADIGWPKQAETAGTSI
ncbi:MAG TPA: radical SAM protein [Micromonosporaceae bacterium]|nr:radical SAM protein [Micromonosporaceae bacterium]HCU51941.1 radical SAM protein [Micromonosporaceae bacterium]